MGLLDGALAAVFGAALAPLFSDGVLFKTVETETGTGGFSASSTGYAIKLCRDAIPMGDRAKGGLPAVAVRLTVLRAGLAVPVELDDAVSLGGARYRVVKVDTDPAGASYRLAAVPA